MNTLTLRPKQVKTIESLRLAFANGHKRIVLCASTGFGKSLVMLDMIRKASDKGTRCVFVCERRNLVEQFSRHLERHGIDHGVMMAKTDKWHPSKKIQVATIQTLERMDSWPAVGLVFLDELHVLMRKKSIRFMEMFPDVKIIGSTATPFHPKIPNYFSKIVCEVTMNELVNDGYLVPFKVFSANEINLDGVKLDSKGEWNESEVSKRASVIVGDVVSDYLKISKYVYGEPRKSICFSAGIAHGAELADAFNAVGVMAIQLSSKDSNEYKAEVIREFSKPDTEIKMLISADLLTRGFDETSIEHVILAKPYRKSFSNYVQAIGRGCRAHEGHEFCVLQDHGGNWFRFEEDWFKLYHNGVTELSSKLDNTVRTERTKKEKKNRVCPKCYALWPKGSSSCLVCGHVSKVMSAVDVIEGEMIEVGKTHKKIDKEFTGEMKERFYQELLGYAKYNGIKQGWAYYKYHERFGVNPCWKKISLPPSPETISYIRHLNIKNAKRIGKQNELRGNV